MIIIGDIPNSSFANSGMIGVINEAPTIWTNTMSDIVTSLLSSFLNSIGHRRLPADRKHAAITQQTHWTLPYSATTLLCREEQVDLHKN